MYPHKESQRYLFLLAGDGSALFEVWSRSVSRILKQNSSYPSTKINSRCISLYHLWLKPSVTFVIYIPVFGGTRNEGDSSTWNCKCACKGVQDGWEGESDRYPTNSPRISCHWSLGSKPLVRRAAAAAPCVVRMLLPVVVVVVVVPLLPLPQVGYTSCAAHR